jgi:Ca2+-binding EF-hand superfamily protein
VYFKKFEERATEKTGGSFTLSDEHLEKSWKLTDFDNSGGVTKDELIHARKMKKCYKK